MARGVDFFEELQRAIRDSYPQAQDADPQFSQQPDHAVRRAVVLRARGGACARASHLRRPRSRLCGHRLRRLPAPSILQVPGAREVAVEFFTLSKSYNMPGWRVGFMVGNRDLVTALSRMKSYHDYGTFTPIQVASIVALEGPQERRARHLPDLPEPARRPVQGAAAGRLGHRDTQGDHVRLGTNSGTLQGCGIARISRRSS